MDDSLSSAWISPFFHEVMRTPLRPPKRVVKKPLLSGGGKSSKVSSIRRSRHMRMKGILKVIVDAEMGESEQHREEFYKKHLKSLSKKELKELIRKIRRISAHLVEPDESDHVNLVHDFAFRVIKERIEYSNKKMAVLQKKISRRAKRNLKPKNSDELKEQYGDIASTFNLLVAKGEIIPDYKGQDGLHFVQEILKK